MLIRQGRKFDSLEQYIEWKVQKADQFYQKLLNQGNIVYNFYQEGTNGRFQVNQKFFYNGEYFDAVVDNEGLYTLIKLNAPYGQAFPWESD